MTMYADDHEDMFPESGDALIPWGQTDSKTGLPSWMQQIFPYTKSQTIYHCPLDTRSAFSYFNGVRASLPRRPGSTNNFISVDRRRIALPHKHMSCQEIQAERRRD